MDRAVIGAQHRSHDLEPHAHPTTFSPDREKGTKILSRLLPTIGSPSLITATEIVSSDPQARMRKVLVSVSKLLESRKWLDSKDSGRGHRWGRLRTGRTSIRSSIPSKR